MDYMQAVYAMTGDIVKYPVEVLCKDELILKCKISCVSDIIVEDVIQEKNTFIKSGTQKQGILSLKNMRFITRSFLTAIF